MLLGSVVIHGTLVIPGTESQTRCPRETDGPMIFFPAEMCSITDSWNLFWDILVPIYKGTIKYQMALGNQHIK